MAIHHDQLTTTAQVGGNEVHYGDIVVPSTGRKVLATNVAARSLRLAQGEMFFVVSPDLCEGGELYNYLVFGNGIKKFSEKIARYFFKQVSAGMQWALRPLAHTLGWLTRAGSWLKGLDTCTRMGSFTVISSLRTLF